jgi:DNA invertase Pin-like site-specific DNA recombinase
MSIEAAQKVTAKHLERGAFVYIRQSTPQQVLENTESTQRQYALRQRAVALGWTPDQIAVIDTDLGQSGASATDREGFQKLMTEVSMGRAGIVLGLEVSRLARNSADWHRLLEISALTDTLILDEDGIYDPSDFNDRLLLGLKGTMSEAELHFIRARMRGGVLSKARRGEFATALPIGLVYDEQKRVVLDPDAQVQSTVRLLFETFRRVGSAFGVVRTFHEQGILFPRRRLRGNADSELFWGQLDQCHAVRLLRNPRCAGAYAYGRAKVRKKAGGRGKVYTRLPRDQWHTLILNAHPGYISWEEYEDNQRRLVANAQSRGLDRRKSPPREGPALLQGLAICGICGARMIVAYHNRHDNLIPDYRCQGRSDVERTVHGICQCIPGAGIDQAIADLLLETMTPVALEVALAVQQELQNRFEEADRIRQAQVERARYEEQLARRRYIRVDPDNRLVADSLEAEWNDKLRALSAAQHDYERQRRADQTMLDEKHRAQILALAADFPQLWCDPNTPDRERKRMVRLLLEDVTLSKTDHIAVHVRFRGGATQSLHLPAPRLYCDIRRHPPELIAEIDDLLDDHSLREIAAILNERGLRSAGGTVPFNPGTISQLRRRYQLKSRYQRLREKGMLTMREINTRLGICPDTVKKWARCGLLRAHAYNEGDACLYEDPGPNLPNKRPGSKLSSRVAAVRLAAARGQEVQCEA